MSLLKKDAIGIETGANANNLVVALTQTPNFSKILDMTAEATLKVGAQPKGVGIADNIEPR